MRSAGPRATVTVMIAALRRWTSLGDIALAALVAGLSAGAMYIYADSAPAGVRQPDLLAIVLILSQALALVVRNRQPVAVYTFVGLTTVFYSVLGYPSPGIGTGVLIAVYTVATHLPLRVVIGVAAIYEVGMAVSVASSSWYFSDPVGTIIFNTAVLVVALVVGVTVRTRRAYIRELEMRASLLEREREEQARLAVALERERIARELHDEVAHALTVMVVQAGAAERLVETDPAGASEALQAITTTGRGALADMRRMLAGLRAEQSGLDLAPQPGVADLPALADRLGEAGLPVELSVQGEARPLPPIVDLSAYRIVQEALTNALRHAGPARARVLLRYGPDALELRITDDGRGAQPPATVGEPASGHGLIGMRERVAIFAGELRAGPRPEGGFAVEASIPLRPEPA